MKSCGPDALTAGVSSQDAKAFCEGGDKQAQSRRGEHEVSRNPSRRESRVVSGYTCGPTPELLPICSGPMGAIGTRLSLRPLIQSGGTKSKARAKMSRERGCVAHQSRHIPTVVPAQAGTHNHEWLLSHDVGTTSPFNNVCCGVWVPACAGTTASVLPICESK